jgi:transcriptional regulator with XRE-family HTH domain
MGETKRPTTRDRQVGARLRAIRVRVGLNLDQAAEATGMSKPTLSRTERGKRRISTTDVAMITTGYQLPMEEREELIEFATSGDSGGWWDRPLPGVPEEVGVLASFEAEATSLTDWSVMIIPGLLQTELYARAVWLAGGHTPEDADLRWVARRRRQEILGKVDYTAFIYEGALRVPFGGPEVQRQQLRHLLAVRDRGVSLHVVRQPQALGLLSHSWLYMEFADVPPVVNVEVSGGAVYLEDDRVEPYRRRLTMLRDLNVSRSETGTTLQQVLKEIR